MKAIKEKTKEQDSIRATNYFKEKTVEHYFMGDIQEVFGKIEEIIFRSTTNNQIPQELSQLKQLLETIRSQEDVEYGYKEIIEILHFIS